MLREAPAMTLRQNLGELLNEVQYRHDQIVITKAGKPVAALIDMSLFERFRQMDNEFERLQTEMQSAFADMEQDDLDELLDEAVSHARQSK